VSRVCLGVSAIRRVMSAFPTRDMPAAKDDGDGGGLAM